VAFNATLHLLLPPRGKFAATFVAFNATLHLLLPQRGKFAATNVAYQCHATFFLPQRGKFVPPSWHINATLLHLILPPIEIGGKIFAGLRARCPLRHDKCRKGL
jgi:hypothetical protein